jgi:uncharacterized protein
VIELLADKTGAVNARLMFSYDESRRRRVEGRVTANVRVLCQRCLESVEIELDESVNLAFVATESIGNDLPAHIDPWVCAEEDFSPLDIIEEQLILGVPFVAFHKACDPHSNVVQELNAVQDDQGGNNRIDNPFAVLAVLKKNAADKH